MTCVEYSPVSSIYRLDRTPSPENFADFEDFPEPRTPREYDSDKDETLPPPTPRSPVAPSTPPYVPSSPVPIEVERPPSLTLPPVPRSQPLLHRLRAAADAHEGRLEEARQVYRRHHQATQRELDNRRKTIRISEPVSRRIQKTIRHQNRRRHSQPRRRNNEVLFCEPCKKPFPTKGHLEIHEKTKAHLNKAEFIPIKCDVCRDLTFFSKEDYSRHVNGRRHRNNLQDKE